MNLLSTAKFVIGAVAALGMGILVDRLGGRLAVLIGTAAGGVAMALFLFATNLPVYYLAGAMLGFSASSIVAAMKVIVSRLYTIHQGAAMGIVLTATSTGGVVMPWIWAPLLDAGWNWRTIIAMMSIGPFLIAVPLWLIFVAMSKKAGPVIKAPTPIQNKLSTWEHFKLISAGQKLLADCDRHFPGVRRRSGRTAEYGAVPDQEQRHEHRQDRVGREPDCGPRRMPPRLPPAGSTIRPRSAASACSMCCWPSRPG